MLPRSDMLSATQPATGTSCSIVTMWVPAASDFFSFLRRTCPSPVFPELPSASRTEIGSKTDWAPGCALTPTTPPPPPLRPVRRERDDEAPQSVSRAAAFSNGWPGHLGLPLVVVPNSLVQCDHVAALGRLRQVYVAEGVRVGHPGRRGGGVRTCIFSSANIISRRGSHSHSRPLLPLALRGGSI